MNISIKNLNVLIKLIEMLFFKITQKIKKVKKITLSLGKK